MSEQEYTIDWQRFIGERLPLVGRGLGYVVFLNLVIFLPSYFGEMYLDDLSCLEMIYRYSSLWYLLMSGVGGYILCKWRYRKMSLPPAKHRRFWRQFFSQYLGMLAALFLVFYLTNGGIEHWNFGRWGAREWSSELGRYVFDGSTGSVVLDFLSWSLMNNHMTSYLLIFVVYGLSKSAWQVRQRREAGSLKIGQGMVGRWGGKR